MVSKLQVFSISKRSIIQTFIAAVIFAVPYKFWLVAPVLQHMTIGGWRLFAVVVAASCGGALSLFRVPMPAITGGAVAGLLLGGTWAAWRIPNDVPVSVGGAFATHLKSFWGEVLILTAAAAASGCCCACFARRRSLLR
jgi:hypothetical protein